MDHNHIPPSLRRLWAEEVLYLHSLWHQGPPQNPSSNPSSNLALINNTRFKKYDKKKKKNPWASNPLAIDIEWPTNSTPDPDAEPSGWPEPIRKAHPRPPPLEKELANAQALQVQQIALNYCRDFFLKEGSDSDEMSEDDEDTDEEEAKAFEFLLAIFKNNGDLRCYYEQNHEKGEFFCLVCGGIGVKVGKRYGNCVALVQHSNSISKTKRRGAHRGFGRVVCSVLGWDINRLPSIVLDLGEPLGKSLVKTPEAQGVLQKAVGVQEIIEISDHDTETDKSSGHVINCKKGKDVVEEDGTVDEKEELIQGIKMNTKTYIKKKDWTSGSCCPLVADVLWPSVPDLGRKPDDSNWAKLIPSPAAKQPRPPPCAEQKARAAAAQVQQNGLKACQAFLAKPDASSSDDEDSDRDEMDMRESVAFKFFMGLFEMDKDLRNYYEKNSVKGEFCCLVCAGIGKKVWKRFGDCLGLVQHSNSLSSTKRWAHMAFARAICEVLGWDINGNPSVALPPRDSLAIIE